MAVVHELPEGRRKEYDVLNPADGVWLHIVEPRSMPSKWLTLDLGAGELAALALALENSTRVSPLRRIAPHRSVEVGPLKVQDLLL